MQPKYLKYLLFAFVVAMVGGGLTLLQGADEEDPPVEGTASYRVGAGPFVRSLRLTGIIESVRYHNVAAPRLVGVTGPGANTLIITKLAVNGAEVKPGDLLVEFDRQSQLKAAFDKRAEYRDLEEQIRKKRAEQEQTRARGDEEE